MGVHWHTRRLKQIKGMQALYKPQQLIYKYLFCPKFIIFLKARRSENWLKEKVKIYI